MSCDYTQTIEFSGNQYDDGYVEEGAMVETSRSVKNRIAAISGFHPDDIGLIDGDSTVLGSLNGLHYSVYTSMAFTLNGFGWTTDFKDVSRAPQHDKRNAS